MTFYAKSGTAYGVSTHTEILTELPPSTFIVIRDPKGNYYLEETDPLQGVTKAYGDLNARAERVLSTFDSRPAATGVLMIGSKGSGKTLLARTICNEAARTRRIPTIIVNQAYFDEGFHALLKSIEQTVVVFFDEFEKVYSKKEEQSLLLSIFDGVYNSKKLFLVTSNDRYAITEYVYNRPGRFFYSFEYVGLEESFVREYCDDTLKNKNEIENVVKFSKLFSDFNFDMLKALIEEMNRYGEGVKKASEWLNAKPGNEGVGSRAGNFSLKSHELLRNPFIDSKTKVPYVKDEAVSVSIYPPKVNPLGSSGFSVSLYTTYEGDNIDHDYNFNMENIEEYSYDRVVMANDDVRIVLEKPKPKTFNYMDSF